MVTTRHSGTMNKNTILAFLFIALILILMPQYYKMTGLSGESDQVNKNTASNSAPEITSTPAASVEIDSTYSYTFAATDIDGETVVLSEVNTPSWLSFTPETGVLTGTPSTRDKGQHKVTLRASVGVASANQSFTVYVGRQGNEHDEHDEVAVTVETNLFTAIVSSRGGGTLQSYTLNNYSLWDGGKVDLIDTTINGKNPMLAYRLGAELDTLTFNFKLDFYEDGQVIDAKARPVTLTYRLSGGPEQINTIKKLTFYPDSYRITIDADITVDSSTPEVFLIWSGGLPVTEKNEDDDKYYFEASLLQGGELFSISGSDGESVGQNSPDTRWVAVRTKYFTSALVAAHQQRRDGATSGHISSTNNDKRPQHSAQIGFDGGSAAADLYLGPLEYDRIADLGAGLEQTMTFGWGPLRPIGKGILWILTNLYEIIPNYGVLLIVFSILVKVVLHPLTRKSYKSTKEMQAIQPLVAELKNKHKGDSQKLNQETMKLYKEHGVNPLGGCLPMLLQMPILFSLFSVFRSTIEFRGAPFVLWITDLSQPDQLFNLPFTIPLLGWSTFNVLPILMGATMIYQQKTMSIQSPSQQKSFMYIMNGFFLIIFYTFPAGLNLYYTCFNALTILQQKYMVPSSPLSSTKPN